MPLESINQSPSDIVAYSSKDLTLADIMRELKEMRSEVEELRTAVTGNGKPMDGMMVRLALIERWRISSDRRATWHTIASIVNFAFTIIGMAFGVVVLYLLVNGK